MKKSVIDILVTIFTLTGGHSELYRDVTAVHLPKLVSVLIGYTEDMDDSVQVLLNNLEINSVEFNINILGL